MSDQKNTPPNFRSFFENVVIDENGSLVVAALSASYASSSGAGFPYTGYARITGSMDISQNLIVKGTASIAHIQYQTSSIIYASGSTKFGDTADDVHQRTGSLQVQGPTTVSSTMSLGGNLNFTQTNTRFVPTQSAQGPGLAIEIFISGAWDTIGWFAP